MSKGLEVNAEIGLCTKDMAKENPIKDFEILIEEHKDKWSKQMYDYFKECLSIIGKELKDYQEIREIAKRYNWDDITGEIFNVETDEKYRNLFNSAIVNIQEDYRKARALEIIKNKCVFVHLLQQSRNMEEYNSLMLIAFKKMAERDYKGAVEKFCLTQGEFCSLKRVLL